jgi:hypothetical protein
MQQVSVSHFIVSTIFLVYTDKEILLSEKILLKAGGDL